MKSNKKMIVEVWLRNNEDIFKKSGLDRLFDFPEGTMQKFFKYNIELNKKRTSKVYRSIKKLIEEFDYKQ